MMKKKPAAARRTPRRGKQNPFPESNRLLHQLQILLGALAPFLRAMSAGRIWKLREKLVAAGVKARSAVERKRVPAPAFLAASVLIAAAAVFTSLFTFGTTVLYDGSAVATVPDESSAVQAINQVESDLSSVLGDDFSLDSSLVSYSTGIVTRSSVVDEQELENNLNSQLDLVTYGYSLYIDGEFIGASTNQEALEALLDQVKAPYLSENTESLEFVEDVEIREGYVATDAISNLGDIVLKLNETKEGEVIYTVEAGDTWIQIANDHGLTSKEMEELNPGFDINKLMIGDELLISNAVPYLTVKVSQWEYYVTEIPYDIEYIDDDTMWEGDTSVVTEGVYGTADTTALVTYVNSEEVSREITEETVTSEPQSAVYKRGTKERPSWAPTGSFRWPTNGSITSRYGSRYIFGSSDFHTGLDIANSYGTNIYAADGGVVVTAGWSGNYGYLVVIDHQNGYQTYYAHNSSLLVSVGDKVYKGQHIAEMGMTGRATGNHCHFEVRYNGNTQNPLNYLP